MSTPNFFELRQKRKFSLLCASGEKVISSPVARNVFRFWTNAPENPRDWKCKTRKGKSLRRTIWNWLPLRIERTLTASHLLLAPERNRPPCEHRFPGSEQMLELQGGPGPLRRNSDPSLRSRLNRK